MPKLQKYRCEGGGGGGSRRKPSMPKSILFLAPIFLANILTCLSISSIHVHGFHIGDGSDNITEIISLSSVNSDNNDTREVSSQYTSKLHGKVPTAQALLQGKPHDSNIRGVENFIKSRNQAAAGKSTIHSNSVDVVVNPSELTFHINEFCVADNSLEKVLCHGIAGSTDLPVSESYFQDIQQATFVNLTSFSSSDIHILDIYQTFPRLIELKVVGSAPNSWSNFLDPQKSRETSDDFVWESLRVINLTGNGLTTESIPTSFFKYFPHLENLDLSHNNISSLTGVFHSNFSHVEAVDISGNPLDCTTNFDWIQSSSLQLLNADKTFCELPPHQNKPKPILKVYPLVKKVRNECRLNCSCFIDYIWEIKETIHSKTTVNCSGRQLTDFPDPTLMPHPTDTLILSHNQIENVETFVEDERYSSLQVMNLYLDNNKISSISALEGSDWIYHFQILSLSNNQISEVATYMLESALRQNKRLYYLDLSHNAWKCDCHTVSSFKVWLLRYSQYVRNIEEVRCAQTMEQVRHMKMEDWCKMEDAPPVIEILDLVSLTLAFLIVVIICKVYYDYIKYKRYGTTPWLTKII